MKDWCTYSRKQFAYVRLACLQEFKICDIPKIEYFEEIGYLIVVIFRKKLIYDESRFMSTLLFK